LVGNGIQENKNIAVCGFVEIARPRQVLRLMNGNDHRNARVRVLAGVFITV
jgi:hypothetical protein